jgi:hypothetical protein
MLLSFFHASIVFFTRPCFHRHKFDTFLRQLDSKISSGATKLWKATPFSSYPSVFKTLVANQLSNDCPLRENGACPTLDGLPEDDYIFHAFLIACRMLGCSCSCTTIRQPAILSKEMSNTSDEIENCLGRVRSSVPWIIRAMGPPFLKLSYSWPPTKMQNVNRPTTGLE